MSWRTEISTVFFDFGDTLWYFPEPTPLETVMQETRARVASALHDQGHESHQAAPAFGPALQAMIQEAERVADRGDLRSPDYIGLARAAARRSGLAVTRAEAEALWQAYNLGGPFLGRRIVPKLQATLSWLLHSGYRLGAITNRALGGTTFLEELRGQALLDFFEVVATSTDVGWRKPHPAIFEYALAAMQVPAKQCVMVGDSLRADVAGGKALGMATVHVRSGNKPGTGKPVATPDYVIGAIAELQALPVFARPAARDISARR